MDDRSANGHGFDDMLKNVLRYLPAPVAIVTSFDPQTDDPVGLAMSAIMPVSLEPCAMAVAVNRSASSYRPMVESGRFCINLLTSDKFSHLDPFADPEARDDRFTQEDWERNGSVWYIRDAPANIFCDVAETVSFGTHDILVGEVYDLYSSGATDILGWADGALGSLIPIER